MSKKQVMKEIFSEKINKDKIYQKVLLKAKEEANMNKVRNKKIIYGITSSAAVVILGFGIIMGTNTLKNVQNPNYGIADLSQDKQSNQESLKINLNINKLKNIGLASLDADIETISIDKLPEEFKFMENIEIPQAFKQLEPYKIYVRSNIDIKKYDLLHDYVFEYKKDDENDIRIAISTIGEPLRDYHIENNDKISNIGDTNLTISQYKEMYIVSFKIENKYFDIETKGLNENELLELLKSILTENSNRNRHVEDKDINAIEQPNENINIGYPDYYAGKYIDKNGNNVVLLCKDNEANRKEICSLLGITEGKTIFKTAKYSYNYLEDLQSKISKKMSNKEFPFVTSSALMDTTNNIKVTVTSNKEEDLRKLKELDSIGGAIDIQYNENGMSQSELLLEKD